jgi:hypothetical protein
MYAGPWRTPLHRLATADTYVGIFLGAVSLAAAALPSRGHIMLHSWACSVLARQSSGVALGRM